MTAHRRPVLGGRQALASSLSAGEHLQREFVSERASALGRMGRRLEEAIDTHRLLVEVGRATPEQLEAALLAIADATWSLLVQRECAGFRGDNLAAIRGSYAVPDAAVRRMGMRRRRR